MMSPETRSFYSAYRLQTSIMPVYLLTALFFYLGWYFNPLRSGLHGGFMFGGLVVFLGISRLSGWLGFNLSRVPRSVVQPRPAQAARLQQLQEQQRLPLELRLVEFGPVPFLAAGGALQPVVWISTHTLERLAADELSCLLEHEAGHLRSGCSLAWWDLLWLIAWPLGWLFGPVPAWYIASALLFAWAWLRLAGWLRWRAELAADQQAVENRDGASYARAMVRHLAEFETAPGSPLRYRRLSALGLSPAEIEELLQG